MKPKVKARVPLARGSAIPKEERGEAEVGECTRGSGVGSREGALPPAK